MEQQPDKDALEPVPRWMFTPRKRTVLLAEIKKGQTIKAACARAGITQTTFYEHLNTEPEFALVVDKARGEAEARLVEAITNGAHTGDTITTQGGTMTVRPGDWRAAAWLLNNHPHTRERYAPINKQQIGGDPDNATPIPVEVVGGQEMSTLERMAAVVTVLQRAGVMPVPQGDPPILLDGPPEPDGTTE